MRVRKRLELYGKHKLRKLLGLLLKPDSVGPGDFRPETISKILVVRQDSRLGNLVLMTPLLSGLKAGFPGAVIDVLISEGFEEVLEHNPNVDGIIVFEKKKARTNPWSYIGLIKRLKKNRYDCAVDVSDGNHFSLNNILLTSLSGARYRLGYDRDDARSFLNLLIPVQRAGTHMAEAMIDLARKLSPDIPDFPMKYYVSDEDRNFAVEWLGKHDICKQDSFTVIHPGGKGKKRWDARNFSGLIDALDGETGESIVLVGGPADQSVIDSIQELSQASFSVLSEVRVGQMAAVIERCSLFISGDTGPMHVSAALERPTVGIFVASDFSVYGPRCRNCRIVFNENGMPAVDEVMNAVHDLLGSSAGT